MTELATGLADTGEELNDRFVFFGLVFDVTGLFEDRNCGVLVDGNDDRAFKLFAGLVRGIAELVPVWSPELDAGIDNGCNEGRFCAGDGNDPDELGSKLPVDLGLGTVEFESDEVGGPVVAGLRLELSPSCAPNPLRGLRDEFERGAVRGIVVRGPVVVAELEPTDGSNREPVFGVGVCKSDGFGLNPLGDVRTGLVVGDWLPEGLATSGGISILRAASELDVPASES